MKNISLNTKLWIYAGTCIFFAIYLLYSFWSKEFKPYQVERNQLKTTLKTKEIELGKIMTQSQRKAQLELEMKKASEDFQQLKEMFPDKDFIPKRLQDLTDASRRASVIPISFMPLQILEKEFYMENHYEITVTSSYHGLGAFFEKIANFKYPTALTNVLITKNTSIKDKGDFEDITNTVKVVFQLKTFTSKK